jgi:hypothetical protein
LVASSEGNPNKKLQMIDAAADINPKGEQGMRDKSSYNFKTKHSWKA